MKLRDTWCLWLFASLMLVTPPALAASPAGFIAKLYTEVLGRMPDQGGWASHVTYFDNAGCSLSTVRAKARSFLKSPEFQALNYSDEGKVLLIYRAALRRNPDVNGYNHFLNRLKNGEPWATIVNNITGSQEFSNDWRLYCAGQSGGWKSATVLSPPTGSSGDFFGGTGSELQALLDQIHAQGGGVVNLAQRAVVRLHERLTVPSGVTLKTYGNLSTKRYADMARIVRNSNFTGGDGTGEEMIQLQPGARLTRVWVDGQRSRVGYHQNDINVRVRSGSAIQIDRNKFTDTAGWTNIQVFGSAEVANKACSQVSVGRNLITAYSSSHYRVGGDARWADGISSACEDSVIHNNGIVDATDVGIVVYRSTPAAQASVVKDNTILHAANSAYGSITVDPLRLCDVGAGRPCHDPTDELDFSGAVVRDNLIWSSRNAHSDIVLGVGTRAWFGEDSALGTGATVIDNSTGSESIKANNGIVVSGMMDATVQGNVLSSQLANYIACPTRNVAASISAGYASGSIQTYYNILVSGCMGH